MKISDDYKDFILKILDAIGYTDDKEVFINRFSEVILFQAVDQLISSSPLGDQERIKEDFRAITNDPGKLNQLLSAHFTEQQIQDALERAAKKMGQDYVTSISTSLSKEQQHNLFNVFEQYNSPTHP